MPDNRGLLREVAWQEVFPWLLLLRTFRLAIDLRKLLLAALGIVLTALGWWAIAGLFSSDQVLPGDVRPWPWPWNQAAMTARPLDPAAGPFAPTDSLLYVPWREARRAFDVNVLWLTGPLRHLFSRTATLTTFAAALLSALWALAVWALFGGAICRIAAVELALEERLALKSAVVHAVRKWPASFAGPLLPLVLIVLLCIPLAILGAMARLDVGVLVAGLVWPLALVSGAVMTLSLVGLILGWPLMWATIGVDGTDSFDSFGRTYSYVYQRPLNYLFYAAVSLAVGAIGWIVVSTAAVLIVHLTTWGVSWGSSEARMRQVEIAAHADRPIGSEPTFPPFQTDTRPLAGIAQIGVALIGFWTSCVRLLAMAFGLSFLWTASTGIYLLLRRDADGREIDEIYVEEPTDDSDLPPVKSDAAGVTVLENGAGDESAPA